MWEAAILLGMFFAILSIPVSSVQVTCSPCSSVGSTWASLVVPYARALIAPLIPSEVLPCQIFLLSTFTAGQTVQAITVVCSLLCWISLDHPHKHDSKLVTDVQYGPWIHSGEA